MPRRRRDKTDGTVTTDMPAPGGTTAELKGVIDSLEKLMTEKADIDESIRDLLASAEDHGFHKKALREAAKRRLETADKQAGREAFEDSLAEMLSRLGMLRDTPLGQAAAEAASDRVRH